MNSRPHTSQELTRALKAFAPQSNSKERSNAKLTLQRLGLMQISKGHVKYIKEKAVDHYKPRTKDQQHKPKESVQGSPQTKEEDWALDFSKWLNMNRKEVESNKGGIVIK